MASPTAAAQSDAFIAHVQDSVPGLLGRYEVPAVDVAVIDGATVSFDRRFGGARDRDVFEVASLTKTATGLAILVLAETGQLDLDAPVNTYLKRWKVPDSRYDEDRVTARAILSHSAGFPIGRPTYDEPSESYPLIETVLDGKETVPAAELRQAPGTGFVYSNPGYGVLELLIEEVTRKPYTSAMRELVFDPLGMEDTGFADDPQLMERRVPGFRGAGNPADQLLRFPRAAGGMLSTARDVGKMLVATLVPRGDGGLLSPEMLQQLHAVPDASKGAFGLGPRGGYALGIAQGDLPSDDTFVANNGSFEGFNAMILGIPAKEAGFVVLTNSDTGLGIELELALSWFDQVAGERPRIADQARLFRGAMRYGAVVALALCAVYLALVARGVRSGRRSWPGSIRTRAVLLKAIPLVALAGGLVVAFDTGTLTSMLGGIAPAKFVSGDYPVLVALLAVALAGAGCAATAFPKARKTET